MKTRKELMEILKTEEGFDTVHDMLERYNTDSVVPGICLKCELVESNCEPDARANHCSECKSSSVQSVLVLAGII